MECFFTFALIAGVAYVSYEVGCEVGRRSADCEMSLSREGWRAGA